MEAQKKFEPFKRFVELTSVEELLRTHTGETDLAVVLHENYFAFDAKLDEVNR